MAARSWFNTRVLCCEETPELAAILTAAKARVSWAPLGVAAATQTGRWKLRQGDWANPDYPYALVEGHEVVVLRWPEGPCAAEQVRWWVSGFLHLAESARRSRVRALGFQFSCASQPLLLHSGRFLEEYLRQLELPCYSGEGEVLAQMERGLEDAH